MIFDKLADVGDPVSRLVLGTSGLRDDGVAFPLYDHYWDLGGNCFDAAHVYAEGRSESVLGRWLERRGNRHEAVIIGKVAHSPDCRPDAVLPQLRQSLDRLQTTHVDVLMLHRDDPTIDVRDFLAALAECRSLGLTHAYGLSNWTLSRTRELCESADDLGLEPPAAISNHFSLARMASALYPGCESFDGPFREWLKVSGTAAVPWSSQARGFFALDDRSAVPRARADQRRHWLTTPNLSRLTRARRLASIKGCSPMNVALAYVLSQEFRTFPIIGPQTVDELADSARALDVELTERELKWLESGRPSLDVGGIG